MQQESNAWLQLLLLFAFLIPVIFFLLTQQKTLQLIRPENRRMAPGQIWLQFIPLFGLVWQFIVIRRISDSILRELNTPTGDSIFAEDSLSLKSKPTYNAGISYATLFCISIVPFPLLKGLAALAGLAAWITYWVQLSRYKKRLKERMLLIS